MALPQINTPTYELEVPSTGEKLKYRPFLVKEEKILMIAMEAEEQSGIINAVKEIVKACTFDKFDVSSLPIFDVEFVFLNIRAKSVGEVSKIKLKCPDDEKTFVETEIDLTEVNVEMNDGHTNKIELTDEQECWVSRLCLGGTEEGLWPPFSPPPNTPLVSTPSSSPNPYFWLTPHLSRRTRPRASSLTQSLGRTLSTRS